MEKQLAPQGTRLSLTTLIENSQILGQINLDRRIKCFVRDWGILTSVVSGVVTGNDLEVLPDPLVDGNVLISAGVALIHNGQFINDDEAYFIYNRAPVSLAVPSGSTTLYCMYSGFTSNNTDIINGFLFGSTLLQTDTEENDSYQFFSSNSATFDPTGSGVVLADLINGGSGAGAVTVTDRRNENVLTLRSVLIDENDILKKDRSSTISGNITVTLDLTVSGDSNLNTITNVAGNDIVMTIPAGQSLIINGGVMTIAQTSSMVTIPSGTITNLTLTDGTYVTLSGTTFDAGTATIDDLTVTTLRNSSASEMRFNGVRGYPFRVGVGVVGEALDPLGGLEVVTHSGIPPIPVGLDSETGVTDEFELQPVSGFPNSNLGGQNQTLPPIISKPNCWIKAWFGDYGVGGQPDGSYTYTVNPSPGWTADQWTGQIASIYDQAGQLAGHYLINSNSSNQLILTSGSGYPAAPVAGDSIFYIGPNASSYNWEITPLVNDNLHRFGNGNEPFNYSPAMANNSIVSAGNSPTKQSIVFDGLQPGVMYEIRVRGVSNTNQYSSWSPYLRVIAGDGPAITMSPVTASATKVGILLTWSPVPSASMYEVVYTLDGSVPDFDSSRNKLVTRNSELSIQARSTVVVKTRTRCYGRNMKVSENASYAESMSGSRGSLVADRHITFTVDRDQAIHTTEQSRLVATHTFDGPVVLKSIQATITRWLYDSPDTRTFKLLVYKGASRSNGTSLLATTLGHHTQLVSANAAFVEGQSVSVDTYDESAASLLWSYASTVVITYAFADSASLGGVILPSSDPGINSPSTF